MRDWPISILIAALVAAIAHLTIFNVLINPLLIVYGEATMIAPWNEGWLDFLSTTMVIIFLLAGLYYCITGKIGEREEQR